MLLSKLLLKLLAWKIWEGSRRDANYCIVVRAGLSSLFYERGENACRSKRSLPVKEFSDSGENLVKHGAGEATGLGILLTWVVGR